MKKAFLIIVLIIITFFFVAMASGCNKIDTSEYRLLSKRIGSVRINDLNTIYFFEIADPKKNKIYIINSEGIMMDRYNVDSIMVTK